MMQPTLRTARRFTRLAVWAPREFIAPKKGLIRIERPCAGAAPDGYTLVAGIWGTHVVNAAIYALPYDVVNDFEPIVLMAPIRL
jgi:hypothetical protein